MHAYNVWYKLEALFNLVSSYNDFKVELKNKIKYSLYVCLFELRFIIIVRYIAAK